MFYGKKLETLFYYDELIYLCAVIKKIKITLRLSFDYQHPTTLETLILNLKKLNNAGNGKKYETQRWLIWHN